MVQLTVKTDGKLGLAALFLAIVILPALCEELMFRGLLLRGFLKTWSPLTAIIVSAVCFAVFHLAPVHALLVFPGGLWLGFVAWRCDSIWPAIFAHGLNNFLALFLLLLFGSAPEVSELKQLGLLLCNVSGIAFIFSLFLLRNLSCQEQELATDLVAEPGRHLVTVAENPEPNPSQTTDTLGK